MQSIDARKKRFRSKCLRKFSLQDEGLRVKKLEKRLKYFVKKLKVAKARWKRAWAAEFGTNLILRIGPASIILSYLPNFEQ